MCATKLYALYVFVTKKVNFLKRKEDVAPEASFSPSSLFNLLPSLYLNSIALLQALFPSSSRSF